MRPWTRDSLILELRWRYAGVRFPDDIEAFVDDALDNGVEFDELSVPRIMRMFNNWIGE